MPENEEKPICDLCCFLRRMFFISWLTFVGAGVISMVAFKGLTALNGKYEGGVYFIGGHGTYHAVSEASYNVMLGVEKLVLLTFLAGMVAMTLNNANKRCREASRNKLIPW